MKEAEDKLDSISNRVAEQSVFTKLTSKTQISDLRKQLEREKEARGKIEAEMNELKQANQEIMSQLKSMQQGSN